MTQIQPAAPQSGDLTCTNPACGATNRAGTRFCASCGTALGASANTGGAVPPVQPAPPPFAPPPPPQPPHFRPQAGSLNGPATMDKSVDVQMAPEWAFNLASQSLTSLGAEIETQNAPFGLTALIPNRSIGKPLRFRCQVRVDANSGGISRISYGIKVDWNSTFLLLGIVGGISLFNLFFLTAFVGLFAPLCAIGAIGWVVYDLSAGIPNKLGNALQKALKDGAPAVRAANGQSAAPMPAPAPAPAPAPVPAPVPVAPVAPVAEIPATPAPQSLQEPTSEEADIVARIEKLAALKERGLLSEAEFEKRRTDLLDRL